MSLVDFAAGFSFDRAALPPVQVWRLSVGQYEEMARAGILDEVPVVIAEREIGRTAVRDLLP